MCRELDQTVSQEGAHGFRFSVIDGLAIVICIVTTYFVYPIIEADAYLFPVVLGHFFLFCNIFRVRRNYELCWSALFLINFSYWRFYSDFNWLVLLACQTPVTLTAISAEIRSSNYHGIFSGGAAVK
jgi:hypothetical protein